ncbi:hypothetical protein AD953_10690 [Acetobacter malorum]|uniref:Uncharacterized protein n=1 Tax=Acetobacter malorum TaxID=178901 RepID=A0A149V445_9PROT|nr:hypothetical protein AD953_10690 [Acetobacter malorum]
MVLIDQAQDHQFIDDIREVAKGAFIGSRPEIIEARAMAFVGEFDAHAVAVTRGLELDGEKFGVGGQATEQIDQVGEVPCDRIGGTGDHHEQLAVAGAHELAEAGDAASVIGPPLCGSDVAMHEDMAQAEPVVECGVSFLSFRGQKIAEIGFKDMADHAGGGVDPVEGQGVALETCISEDQRGHAMGAE